MPSAPRQNILRIPSDQQHDAAWMEDQGLKNRGGLFRETDSKTGESATLCKQGSWDLPEEFHYTKWKADRIIADLEKSLKEGKPFMTRASCVMGGTCQRARDLKLP